MLRGKIGGHTSWANTVDRSGRTKPARDALYAKFLAEADNDPQRAQHLWKAHFNRLAPKSAAARRKVRKLTSDAVQAEAELAALGGSDHAPAA